MMATTTGYLTSRHFWSRITTCKLGNLILEACEILGNSGGNYFLRLYSGKIGTTAYVATSCKMMLRSKQS